MTGCTCAEDADCAAGLRCAEGACRPTVEGDRCDHYPCAAPLVCGPSGTCIRGPMPGDSCATDACSVGRCNADQVCVAAHHPGCDCASDDDCPYDVSRCVAGVCTLRPMLGEACDASGAPCFGSICDGGSCRLIGQGEGPCAYDSDCQSGLTCSATLTARGLCGTPRTAGEPCGPNLAGGCASALFCNQDSGSCRPRGRVGESCANRPCVEGASCSLDTHLCIAS